MCAVPRRSLRLTTERLTIRPLARHDITVNELLRHTAGLKLGSSLQASLGAAFEPVNRMKFMESDMAAYAESIWLATPPGSRRRCSNGARSKEPACPGISRRRSCRSTRPLAA